jgi:hypothetical protein
MAASLAQQQQQQKWQRPQQPHLSACTVYSLCQVAGHGNSSVQQQLLHQTTLGLACWSPAVCDANDPYGLANKPGQQSMRKAAALHAQASYDVC